MSVEEKITKAVESVSNKCPKMAGDAVAQVASKARAKIPDGFPLSLLEVLRKEECFRAVFVLLVFCDNDSIDRFIKAYCLNDETSERKENYFAANIKHSMS